MVTPVKDCIKLYQSLVEFNYFNLEEIVNFIKTPFEQFQFSFFMLSNFLENISINMHKIYIKIKFLIIIYQVFGFYNENIKITGLNINLFG